MIRSFRDKDTERLFKGSRVARWANIERSATIKLQQLNAATTLDFLKVPPGNRLELLTKERKGQYSIRVNQQWRICFNWTANGPAEVEITDYH